MTLPGVRLRVNIEGDLPADTYLLMLQEVPMVMGTVESGKIFAVASSQELQACGVPLHDIDVVKDPATGSDAAWLPSSQLTRIEPAGLTICENPQALIVRHLEALVKRNLADFLDVQQVHSLLEEWQQQDQGAGAALLLQALPDHAVQVRFARVLRALVAEQISIAQWRSLVEIVAERSWVSEDAAELLVAIRLRLTAELAAAMRERLLLEMPPTLEQDLLPYLEQDNERTFFALPPQTTQDALSEIRALVSTHDNTKLALITRSGELRAFVRRLVELEFPDLMVFSAAEVQRVGLQAVTANAPAAPATAVTKAGR
jgi:flagellar biosynthesis component FlhA